jgi:hypothetical protein
MAHAGAQMPGPPPEGHAESAREDQLVIGESGDWYCDTNESENITAVLLTVLFTARSFLLPLVLPNLL